MKKQTWKQALTEVRHLTAKNGVNAWRTAVAIRQVLNDPRFQADCNNSLKRMDEHLIPLAARFALTSTEMVQMLEHFPKQEEWKSGRLDILRDKTAVQLLKRNGKATSTSSTKKRAAPQFVSREKYDKLLKRCELLEKENKELRKEVASTKRQLASIRDAVAV